MNDILLRVLAVVLSGVSPEYLPEQTITFERMPAACVSIYDVDILKFRFLFFAKVASCYLFLGHFAVVSEWRSFYLS